METIEGKLRLRILQLYPGHNVDSLVKIAKRSVTGKRLMVTREWSQPAETLIPQEYGLLLHSAISPFRAQGILEEDDQ